MPKTPAPTKRIRAAGAKPAPGARPRREVAPPVFSGWTFLTNHAHVLVLLDSDPEMILREVAGRVGITERAVQRIVMELEEGGFLERKKVGRRNRYRVIAEQAFRHPIESHCRIGDLLRLLREQRPKESPSAR